VSKRDNHTKEKAEGDQIQVSIYRMLKLYIFGLEAEIRLEQGKAIQFDL